ncbi:MAG TPA: FCD domain-containing protein [Acidimicrobiales bacterium]|nr:FCD domain-containing protein [Acidimicrobiales bacterium]
MQTASKERIRGVAEAVLSDAAQKGLLAGSRLPTERELSEGLRLTRSTIRNAMALLESDGVVSREVGRGTYLRFDPEDETMKSNIPMIGASATLKDIGPADVMAVRQLLEPTALSLAVTQATEEDFEEMDRCLRGRVESSNYDEFEKRDLAFHRCLVLASHNTLLIRMYLLIEVARQGELWGNLKRRADSIERRGQYSNQHKEIVVALRNRDGRGAYDAMTAHLNAVQANLEMSARI